METTQSSTAPSAAPDLSSADLGIDVTPTTFTDTPANPAPVDPEANLPVPPFKSDPAEQEDDFVSKALNRPAAPQPAPQQSPQKSGRPARDFTGLDEAEKEMFNNMSRSAYEKLYPLFIKLKGKEGLLDELDKVPTYKSEIENLKKAPKPVSYYDDPDAYMLSQSYRQALVERSQTQELVDFWKDQLIAVESGQPFKALQQTENGYVETQPIKPSAAAKVEIGNILNQFRNQLNAQNARLENLKHEHGNTYKSYVDTLTGVHNKVFGKHEATLKPLADKELEAFPEFTRGRPEVKSLAYAYALLKHIVSLDKSNKTTAAANAATARAAKSSGPSMDTVTAGVNGQPTLATDEDYKKFRAEFMQ